MSLNWNVTKCNRKPTGETVADCNDASHDGNCQVCPRVPESLIHDAAGQPIPWAVTNGLIWASMAVGMPGIADVKAAREFAFRLAFYQETFGAWLNMTPTGPKAAKLRPEPRKITTAEVFAHIGLSTNVSLRTRGQFLKSMSEQVARDVERDISTDVLAILKAEADRREQEATTGAV